MVLHRGETPVHRSIASRRKFERVGRVLSRMRRVMQVLVALLLILLAGCSRSQPEPPMAASFASVAAAPAAGAPAADRSGAASTPERKLVRSAEIQLEVESHAQARAQIEAALQRAGGYIADARVDHADGAVVYAQLSLRVPASALDAFLAELTALGSVQSEQLHSNDITDVYFDTAARLTSARKLEERLLQFAGDRTSDVKGLLEVERELGRVREEIETLQARVTGYDRSVAYSAVSLTLTSRDRVSMAGPLGLSDRLRHAFADSVHALGAAGRGLLVMLAFLAPWLPVIGVAFFVVLRLTRRSKLAPRP
jgi:hypothetical protein